MAEFKKNPELNKSYTIPGADHEVEIQDPKFAYKGPLSDIRTKEICEYLIGRGHELIAMKGASTTTTAAPAQSTTGKPA